MCFLSDELDRLTQRLKEIKWMEELSKAEEEISRIERHKKAQLEGELISSSINEAQNNNKRGRL